MSIVDSEFLDIFRDEARGRLDRIVDTLLALENGSAAADAVDALFRDVHTIKGAAGMVGLDEIGALAHVMEDLLAGARQGGALPDGLVDPLLRASDSLRRHVEGDGEPTDALLAELAAAQAPGAGPAVEAHNPAPPAAGQTAPAESRSIRVPAEKIDTLLDLVGETVLHRRRLEHELGAQGGTGGHGPVADELDFGERLLDELKGAAIGMRTLPLSSIVTPLPRVVRDLAAETGREVELVVVGAETELDRAILEGLPDPLIHMIRNAIAHGIETPQERERRGKPARGRVELRAEQRGGMVEITVADDGRGISEETLAEARRVGSLTEVLTQPGFSTAREVSGISGRGVGLDAVKEQVEGFGGSIEVRSEPGTGMEVILRLPLALALIEVLLVERAGNVYGFPLASVEEVLSLGATLSLAGRPSIELRGNSILLADLAALLGESAEPPARAPVVVLSASGRRVAIICDGLLGKEEVVVKSLGPLLSSLSIYLGAAILGDGRIALLVDPAVLVRSSTERGAAAAPVVSAAEPSLPRILVVEDSLTIRELQRSILEAAGYRVQTARNGRDALTHIDGDAALDLVVSDVEMPEMDGIELTRAIRAHATRSALPVVIVTSLGDDEHRQRGIDAGADAYMVKQSFDQHDLLETVERLVGR
ncbi:MAG: two-component system, chemotaxis family, sensor kinase CheA [Solirubrobacteraceae bacterium]|jgi:two-component system chemotaxis sensor kinase CheA|nr:two-component system, chemotaxis family, sensor kinase CheA [Solirubrobacteraceae bacterium]